MKPQTIKITANKSEKSGHYANRIFCPFQLIKEYMAVRGDYNAPEDQFLCFWMDLQLALSMSELF